MIIKPSKRRRKAYAVSFKIGYTYLRLNLFKKLLSQAAYERKLNKLHEKNAKRAKNAILELNGLFIKVGQLVSIMSNVVCK